MIRTALVLVVLMPLVLMGCRQDATASVTRTPGPKQTAARMLALAEAGDWAAYVDDYYGETHKFRTDDDRRQLIGRYETRWGEQVIGLLRQVVTMEPQLSDDGSQAFFDFGNGQRFTLYREPDGRWKFHL